MIFRKITASKYIGSNNFNLRLMRDGCFAVCIGNTVTNWGTGFKTVRAAENFLKNRDILSATVDYLPPSADDIEFLIEMYGFESTPDRGFKRNDVLMHIGQTKDGKLVLKIKKGNKEIKVSDMDYATSVLDSFIPEEDIFASVILRGIEFRSILAAKNTKRRSAREITKDLVRVKSSNIWAYGIEIKDSKSKVGDVYIQFKGKNGGPEDVYKYYDVDINVWRKVLSSPSKGHAVWKYLRNNYYYSKLTGDRKGVLPNAIN